MNFILCMQMHYGKRKNPISFGGGQSSSGVTRDQTLKILLAQHLEVGSLDEFHTQYVINFIETSMHFCILVVILFGWNSKTSSGGTMMVKVVEANRRQNELLGANFQCMSHDSMFPGFDVPRVRCSQGPMLTGSNVPRVRCSQVQRSRGSTFPWFDVPEIQCSHFLVYIFKIDPE